MAGKRTRVCYLIGSLKIGGAERHVTKLLGLLDRDRVEPLLAVYKKQGAFLPVVEQLGVPIHEIGLDGLWRPRTISALWQFGRYLRRQKVDILHAFLWEANFIGAVTGRLAGTRVVTSKRNMNDWMTWPYLMINRLANTLSHRVTAVSRRVGESVVAREGLPAAKLVVVPNGVDMPEGTDPQVLTALRRDLGLSDDEGPLVGVVASLAPRKGHGFLFEAVQQVKEQFPAARFLLIGDGVLRQELEGLAQRLGVREMVRFLGYRQDVPALLDLIDIFALPSLEEGMSNALMEAMAHGLPAVATDVGGNGENIEPGRSGLLVAPGDAQELAAALLRVIGDKELRDELGRAARARMEAEFSMERAVARNQQIYQELMGEGGR